MTQDTNQSIPSAALVNALTCILRPLVRLLIRHQITFPFISQLLKSVYLEMAVEASPGDAKRITDSRLSLLTGVHRKDVRRLRQENEAIAMPEIKATSLGAQVVAAWLGEKAYTDRRGQSLALFRLEKSGAPSFETLVEEVSRQDVRSRSLLDEWLRSGVVTLDNDDKVHLVQDAFIPPDNFDEKVFFFGHNLHDHIAAGVDNLSNEKTPFFDRGVYYNNLKPESVTELQSFINKEAMVLLRSVNKKARQMQKKDSVSESANRRFRFGAYYYSERTDMTKKGSADEKD